MKHIACWITRQISHLVYKQPKYIHQLSTQLLLKGITEIDFDNLRKISTILTRFVSTISKEKRFRFWDQDEITNVIVDFFYSSNNASRSYSGITR